MVNLTDLFGTTFKVTENGLPASSVPPKHPMQPIIAPAPPPPLALPPSPPPPSFPPSMPVVNNSTIPPLNSPDIPPPQSIPTTPPPPPPNPLYRTPDIHAQEPSVTVDDETGKITRRYDRRGAPRKYDFGDVSKEEYQRRAAVENQRKQRNRRRELKAGGKAVIILPSDMSHETPCESNNPQIITLHDAYLTANEKFWREVEQFKAWANTEGMRIENMRTAYISAAVKDRYKA